MTLEQAFLEDILERPDDDAPRLIFADWLEDNGDADRGELIRVQIAKERDPNPAGKGYLDKAVALVERNWARWVAPLARLIAPEPYEPWLQVSPPDVLVAAESSFRRGLITSLTMSAATFLRHGEEISSLAPLVRLRLRAADQRGRLLAQSPALRWIRTLEFVDHLRAPVDALDIRHLAASSRLPRLSALSLYGHNLGDAGLAELLRARWLPQLTDLDLSDTGLSGLAIAALARCDRFDKLDTLYLDKNQLARADLNLLSGASWFGRLSSLGVSKTQIDWQAARTVMSNHPGLQIGLYR